MGLVKTPGHRFALFGVRWLPPPAAGDPCARPSLVLLVLSLTLLAAAVEQVRRALPLGSRRLDRVGRHVAAVEHDLAVDDDRQPEAVEQALACSACARGWLGSWFWGAGVREEACLLGGEAYWAGVPSRAVSSSQHSNAPHFLARLLANTARGARRARSPPSFSSSLVARPLRDDGPHAGLPVAARGGVGPLARRTTRRRASQRSSPLRGRSMERGRIVHRAASHPAL